MEPSSEEKLIRQAQAGDTDAFAALVVAHQTFVYNLALGLLGNTQEAEDIAQEAFVRAWLALSHFQAKARFRTWLYRIVTNLCYNRLPRLRRDLAALNEETFQDIPDELTVDPVSHVETQETRQFLHREIEALPESYRLLILLRYRHELSYQEIAETLDLPLGTVKTGLFRARARLKEALRKYEEGLS